MTQARLHAVADMANFVATAVAYQNVFKNIDTANIVSHDEMSVHLGKVPKNPTKVATTADVQKEFRKQKRSLKSARAAGGGFQDKGTMAKITITFGLTGAFGILYTIIAIREQDYKKKKKKGEEPAAAEWTFSKTSVQVDVQHNTLVYLSTAL